MTGGNIIFFQDRINANLQVQQAEPIASNLFNLLRSWGIQIKDNLVMDANCGQVQVQRQQGIFRFATPVSYPFFPIINNVNKEHLMVKNLDQMQLIFASEIDTTRINEQQQFEPLLFTSQNSGQVRAPNLDIQVASYMNRNLAPMLTESPKVVAGIFSGVFKSFFADNYNFPNAIKETSAAKVLFITDSDFIKDSGGAGLKGNLDFVMNAVDYMASESTLIEIRSRETEFKPLKELSSSTRKIVKWLNILFPSILLIIFGVFHYRKEINRRKILGELYE